MMIRGLTSFAESARAVSASGLAGKAMRLMLTTQAIEIMRRALAKFMVPAQKRVTRANEPIIGQRQITGRPLS